MSSVITTRMFGRPSVSAPAGRAMAAGAATRPRARSAPSAIASDRLRAFAVSVRPCFEPSSRFACRGTLHHVSHYVNLPASPHPMSVATRQTRARLSREESRARIVAAATELVRELSYAELSVGAIMERAGLERTIFYRHFDDLADLLMRAGREAIEELYETQVDLSAARDGAEPEAVRAAIEPAVAVYRRHGPLLRALAEGAAARRRGRRRARRGSGAASTSWSRER